MLIAPAAWQPVTKAFVRIAPPDSDQLHAARFGSRSWSVRFAGDKLVVSLTSTEPPKAPFRPYIDTAELGYYGTQPNEALKVPGDGGRYDLFAFVYEAQGAALDCKL